ncbi:MAG: VanW family protein [Acidimicrobiia bacterium]
MSRHRNGPGLRTVLISAGVAAILFIAAVIAFYVIDTSGDLTTVRGLRIDDVEAGNLVRDQLDEKIDSIRRHVEQTPVRINLPDRTHQLPAADLGITLDTDDIESRALEAGHLGGALDRFSSWLGSFTSTTRLSTRLKYSPATAAATVAGFDDLIVTPPTEPSLTLAPGEGLVVREGSDGVQVDQAAIVSRLGHQVEANGPFDVDAPTRPLPPLVSDDEAQQVADEMNDLTADGVEVRVLDEERKLSPLALRLRLDVTAGPDGPTPQFDLDSLQNLIENTFRSLAADRKDPVFEVVDDKPVLIEPGAPPMKCCAPGAAREVAKSVLDGSGGPVTVAAQRSTDPRELSWAKGTQIVEKVAEFTTKHHCCEARVSNIHRFADIIRGAYLVPGESLSLNEYVGMRTRDKGFVPAGTILQGHLVATVGGGVSQFATTMFNAAFFAGFDFVDYQSHSIYFSRYPYGREATISWPAPDLNFTNTTKYPALIWTSYDDTSITVSIYSTKSVEVEQTDQEVSRVRQCTRVDTYRLRTYDDGHSVEDSVFATYRPREGLDCNGNPTPLPNE